jgi:hypothetical protein
VSDNQRIELRCPNGPRRLFAKLAGTPPRYVEDEEGEGALIELACADCRKTLQRRGQDCAQVLHYFNILGELVRTEAVPVGAASE